MGFSNVCWTRLYYRWHVYQRAIVLIKPEKKTSQRHSVWSASIGEDHVTNRKTSLLGLCSIQKTWWKEHEGTSRFRGRIPRHYSPSSSSHKASRQTNETFFIPVFRCMVLSSGHHRQAESVVHVIAMRRDRAALIFLSPPLCRQCRRRFFFVNHRQRPKAMWCWTKANLGFWVIFRSNSTGDLI